MRPTHQHMADIPTYVQHIDIRPTYRHATNVPTKTYVRHADIHPPCRNTFDIPKQVRYIGMRPTYRQTSHKPTYARRTKYKPTSEYILTYVQHSDTCPADHNHDQRDRLHTAPRGPATSANGKNRTKQRPTTIHAQVPSADAANTHAKAHRCMVTNQ